MFDPSKKASTVASEAIRTAIGSRATAAYNQAKTEHSHRTVAYLPDEIIRLLQYEPSLITKAATTFYERDAIQLKVCPVAASDPRKKALTTRSTSRLANTCADSGHHLHILLQCE
jgi:hypothetical protein